jgi:hypothetical protein
MRNESVTQFTLDFCRKAGRNADTFHFTPLLARAAGFFFVPPNPKLASSVRVQDSVSRNRVEPGRGRFSLPDDPQGRGTFTAGVHAVAETWGACLWAVLPLAMSEDTRLPIDEKENDCPLNAGLNAKSHGVVQPRGARSVIGRRIASVQHSEDSGFPFLTFFTGCCGSDRAVPHTGLSLGGSFLFCSFFPFYL